MTQSPLPVGNVVQPIGPVDLPQRTDYTGKFVTLSPVNPKADVAELYGCSHGSDIKEQIWTYMSYGPFDSTHSMRKWLEEGADSEDPLFFTVHHLESKQSVGMVSFFKHRFRHETAGTRTYMVFTRFSEIEREHRSHVSHAL